MARKMRNNGRGRDTARRGFAPLRVPRNAGEIVGGARRSLMRQERYGGRGVSYRGRAGYRSGDTLGGGSVHATPYGLRLVRSRISGPQGRDSSRRRQSKLYPKLW